MPSFVELFRHSYRPLSTRGSFEKEEEVDSLVHRNHGTLFCLLIMFCATFVGGTAAGRFFALRDEYGLPRRCGETRAIWHLNETFARRPDPEAEAAWQSIVPEGKGFVTHPQLAPVNKDLSVFHQLHCLHGLRVAYYKSLHEVERLKNTSYADPFLENIGVHVSAEHIQHCFDYLRQALMCAADTNLEYVSPDTHSTTGWGFERTCRDYWQVFRWAEKWRNNHYHNIS